MQSYRSFIGSFVSPISFYNEKHAFWTSYQPRRDSISWLKSHFFAFGSDKRTIGTM